MFPPHEQIKHCLFQNDIAVTPSLRDPECGGGARGGGGGGFFTFVGRYIYLEHSSKIMMSLN